MNPFRILNPFPAYLDQIGLPASGGHLRFYQSGTDTPKDVYGDPDLTVNNGSEVLIGTDGRTVVDVWGDGSYRVRLYAADNTLIAEAEDVEIPGGTGAQIPALSAGKFLTNDGAVMLWEAIREVPDPTGQSQKVLANDGTSLFWQALPSQVNPEVNPSKFKIGTFLIQWGTDTAPASGDKVTSKGVTFPTAYVSAPFVVLNHGGTLAPGGFIGTLGAAGVSAGGFTAQFDVNVANTGSSFNIVSPVPFSWLAIGTVSS